MINTVPDTESVLRGLDERQRAEVVAAFMAVEHAGEPVHEGRFPALREPATRRKVSQLLQRSGRTLLKTRKGWTSGYRDDVMAELAADPACRLGETERAVLTLVLIYSVAIPRAQNQLAEDSWLSPFPAPMEELQQRSMLGVGEVEEALRRLRHAGLVSQVLAPRARALGETTGGYIPGPQFHRLTPAARARLQEELILAAGPDSPLAAAIRARRRSQLADVREPSDSMSAPNSGVRGGGAPAGFAVRQEAPQPEAPDATEGDR